jgi:D-serine deaminase-like pyridoxal phosphate-dependent protein
VRGIDDQPRLPGSLQDRLTTPALLIDLDRVRHNLGRVVVALGGDPGRWRPHVKTAKIPAVLREFLRAGVRAFKCATTREALCLLGVLRRHGAGGDVLLAHPLAGPNLRQLARVAHEHPGCRVGVLADDPACVESIPRGLGIFLDVDPGMGRTGMSPERIDDAIGLGRRAGDAFRGVHFYEGHLHGLDAQRRRREAFACYGRLIELLDALASAGVPVPEVVTSGTPTFLEAQGFEPFRRLPGTLHRVSPGTVAYHDLRSEEEVPALGLLPAALVLARVVSRPAPDVVTTDAGSKSVAAEAGNPCAAVAGWPHLTAMKPSEEHLPFRVGDGEAPRRGQGLLLVPRHVCPTVNLAERAVLLDGGCFAGIVDVAARAHELLVEEPAALA